MLARAILAFCLLTLVGCATKSESKTLRTFKIAGNKAVDLPVTKDGAILPTENSDIRIEVTGYLIDAENRELVYTFGFREKKKAAPRSVVVEDVSGDTSEVLVADLAPELDSNGSWKGNSIPRRRFDPSLGWATDLGDTIKVFRFTIILADGRPFILHQASIWSGAAKQFVREILGYDAPAQKLK
jgi:hypothetical protein